MIAGAEGQFRVNRHIHSVARVIGQVCGVVYHAEIVNIDWFKAFLLPCLVPVLVFRLLERVGSLDALDGEVLKAFVKNLFMEHVVENVAVHAFFCLYETLEAYLSRQRCRDVACRSHHLLVFDGAVVLVLEGENHFYVFHNPLFK